MVTIEEARQQSEVVGQMIFSATELEKRMALSLLNLASQVEALQAQRDDLMAALEDARTYIECTVLNASSPKTRMNYGGCLNRIDAAIAKAKP